MDARERVRAKRKYMHLIGSAELPSAPPPLPANVRIAIAPLPDTINISADPEDISADPDAELLGLM
jgi:hypothetical protein